MLCHRWFPWINSPAPAAIPVTSDKLDQDQSSDYPPAKKTLPCRHICPMMVLSTLCFLLLVTCVALSVMYRSSRPEWKNLIFDYQNITENYITVTTINAELKRENEILKEHNTQLEEQTTLLNKTLVKFMSRNLATTWERVNLMEQIVNLTSINAYLTDENDKLVQCRVEQEERLVNLSQTLTDLSTSNTELQAERQRLSETNGLLQDQLLNVKEVNQKLQSESKEESEQLRWIVKELREQNQNLSFLLEMERTDSAQYEEKVKIESEIQSIKESCQFLDNYCPVVNERTQERVCKKCAESWTLFQSKCYYFSSGALGWSSSRAWCQTHGADLLVINSQEEQNFIYATSQTGERTNTRLWIGMTDEEQEGDWRWVDGHQVTSGAQYWLDRPGVGTEPDDWQLDDPQGEDCGHIDSSEEVLRSWMDGSCKTSYRWICEMNL